MPRWKSIIETIIFEDLGCCFVESMGLNEVPGKFIKMSLIKNYILI